MHGRIIAMLIGDLFASVRPCSMPLEPHRTLQEKEGSVLATMPAAAGQLRTTRHGTQAAVGQK